MRLYGQSAEKYRSVGVIGLDGFVEALDWDAILFCWLVAASMSMPYKPVQHAPCVQALALCLTACITLVSHLR